VSLGIGLKDRMLREAVCGLWAEVVIFFAQIVVLFKSFPNFAPDFAREAKAVGRGSLRRVKKVENLSRIIW
jgi:hypothetical protein